MKLLRRIANALKEGKLLLHLLYCVFRRKPPPESDSSRHPNPIDSAMETFGELIRSEIAQYAKVAKAATIKID